MSGNDRTDDGNVELIERDLYPVREAGQRLGVSEPTAWRLIGAGRLGVVRLGRRTLVTPEAIAALKAELVAEAEAARATAGAA